MEAHSFQFTRELTCTFKFFNKISYGGGIPKDAFSKIKYFFIFYTKTLPTKFKNPLIIKNLCSIDII